MGFFYLLNYDATAVRYQICHCHLPCAWMLVFQFDNTRHTLHQVKEHME